MTFRYGLSIPAAGGNKVRRLKQWAKEHRPDVEYRLPSPARDPKLYAVKLEAREQQS
jgi:hypothetical protein